MAVASVLGTISENDDSVFGRGTILEGFEYLVTSRLVSGPETKTDGKNAGFDIVYGLEGFSTSGDEVYHVEDS